jgi:hypothetical protein
LPREAAHRGDPHVERRGEHDLRAQPADTASNDALDRAFQSQASNVQVEGAGAVAKVLQDDE